MKKPEGSIVDPLSQQRQKEDIYFGDNVEKYNVKYKPQPNK